MMGSIHPRKPGAGNHRVASAFIEEDLFNILNDLRKVRSFVELEEGTDNDMISALHLLMQAEGFTRRALNTLYPHPVHPYMTVVDRKRAAAKARAQR